MWRISVLKLSALILSVSALGMFAFSSVMVPSAPIRFRNVAAQWGLDFILEHHPTDRKHLVETMAGGVAAFDYDNDGWTDIFFSNGASVPDLKKKGRQDWNRLFRNEGGLKFRDVTESSGLTGSGYSTAAAAADFDNDGHIDLFVGGVRENKLYRNEGNGRFRDVSTVAGIGCGRWCEGAAWLDYNNDGRLDLFVVNYLQWTSEFDVFCGDSIGKIRAYCHPRLFAGLPNTLYRNEGNGKFTDVSDSAGIGKHVGKGMSAAIADYDQDGFIDVFVTNDKLPNFLFHNKGDGTFEEVALEAGVALQDNGVAVSGMGMDFRDYSNDANSDIVFAALAGETFPIFLNLGKGLFSDAGQLSQLALLTREKSGWSIGIYDFDNDGWKDLFTSNGHVNDTVEAFEAAKYKLTNSVFSNVRDGTFRDASVGSGFDLEPPRSHRGSAFADFNHDGKIDIVTVSLGEPVELWENRTGAPHSWLLVKLLGRKSNRDGIGAVVRIGTQVNHMTTAVGYMSSSHSGVHFGLGTARQAERIEIRWPSGTRQVLEHVTANRTVEVTEP
ncbi:MAG: CRTAC1 family protein [Acidobacteriota bacterium]